MTITEYLLRTDDDLDKLKQEYKLTKEEVDKVDFFPSIIIILNDKVTHNVIKIIDPGLISKYQRYLDDMWD